MLLQVLQRPGETLCWAQFRPKPFMHTTASVNHHLSIKITRSLVPVSPTSGNQNKDRRRRHEMELKNNRNQSVEVMKSHMSELFWFHSRVQGVSGQRRTLLSMPTNHRSRIQFSSYIHATEERYRVHPLGSRTVVHKLHGCRESKGRGVTPPPVNHRTAETFNLTSFEPAG